MMVHACTIAMAMAQLHRCIRKSKVVRRLNKEMARVSKVAYDKLPNLQMAYACPMSRPMVKFRKGKKTAKSHRLRSTGHRRNAVMMLRTLVTFKSTRHGLNQLHFDTESAPIRIDNCCSKCITNDIKDLIPSSIKKTTKMVRGFNGKECAATCRGTLRWSWDDDLGVRTTFLIPNSYYALQAISKLLCPQHWAQEAADHTPFHHGTGCDTNDRCVTLYWNQRANTRTVPLDPSINVGVLYTTTGYQARDDSCQVVEASMATHNMLCCHDLGIASDDKGEEEEAFLPIKDIEVLKEKLRQLQEELGPKEDLAFNLQGPLQQEEDAREVDIDEEDHIDEPALAKMLREHHQLTHLPFSRMRAMSRAGLLPSTFQTCQEPVCSSCLYGKAMRRPWRTKGSSTGGLKRATYTGQCVAVNQSKLLSPGLVAQLKGIPTKKRYTCATVFVDLFSDFSYVHFQYSANAAETVEAKHAFEKYARSHGVAIKAYHANNSRFAEKLWLADSEWQGQRVTYSTQA